MPSLQDTARRTKDDPLPGDGGGWQPIAERPAFDQQPIRQFILVDGERTHNGTGPWSRRWAGVAFIDRSTPHGYRQRDIQQILEDGDMDQWGWSVTHWMPAQFPIFPEPQP